MTTQLNERNAIISRTLPDGRVLDLWVLTFGRVRLTVSATEEAQGYLEGW